MSVPNLTDQDIKTIHKTLESEIAYMAITDDEALDYARDRLREEIMKRIDGEYFTLDHQMVYAFHLDVQDGLVMLGIQRGQIIN